MPDKKPPPQPGRFQRLLFRCLAGLLACEGLSVIFLLNKPQLSVRLGLAFSDFATAVVVLLVLWQNPPKSP